MQEKHHKYDKFDRTLLTAYLVVIVYMAIGILLQPQISLNGGKGYDGVYYSEIAEQIADGQVPASKSPFVYRIGTPALVAFFAADISPKEFRSVNFLASVISIALLISFLRLYLNDEKHVLLFAILYIMYWQAPLRLTFFYPVHTDPFAIVFLLASLIAVTKIHRGQNIRKNLSLLTLLTVFGVIFREITIAPALALALSTLFSDGIRFARNSFTLERFRYYVPSIAGLIVFATVVFSVNKTDDSTFFGATLGWLYEKSVARYLHAWFLAFGPVLLLAFFDFSSVRQFFAQNKPLLYYFLLIAFVGWVGGSDTERLLYWSAPVIFVLAGKFLSERSELLTKPMLAFLAITQLISMRAFLLIPDEPSNYQSVIPFLTPLTNEFPLFDLWSWHGNVKMNIISFIQYIFLFGILFFWLKKNQEESRIDISG